MTKALSVVANDVSEASRDWGGDPAEKLAAAFAGTSKKDRLLRLLKVLIAQGSLKKERLEKILKAFGIGFVESPEDKIVQLEPKYARLALRDVESNEIEKAILEIMTAEANEADGREGIDWQQMTNDNALRLLNSLKEGQALNKNEVEAIEEAITAIEECISDPEEAIRDLFTEEPALFHLVFYFTAVVLLEKACVVNSLSSLFYFGDIAQLYPSCFSSTERKERL